MSITSYECTLLNRELMRHMTMGNMTPYYNLAGLLESVLEYKVMGDVTPRKLYREKFEDYEQAAFRVLADPDQDVSGPIPKCFVIYCSCRSPIDPRDTFYILVDFNKGLKHCCCKDCAVASVVD